MHQSDNERSDNTSLLYLDCAFLPGGDDNSRLHVLGLELSVPEVDSEMLSMGQPA